MSRCVGVGVCVCVPHTKGFLAGLRTGLRACFRHVSFRSVRWNLGSCSRPVSDFSLDPS